MVAKSYQGLEIISDVFTSSGRQYVNVKLKSGATKTVRWYSEYEYNKLYPGNAPVVNTTKKTQKEIFGFDEGYITIFKGNTYAEIDWFRESVAKYNRLFGWYISSGLEMPEVPCSLEPIQLAWDLVGNEDGSLKEDHIIKQVIEALVYEESTSEFVGTIGQRLELVVKVERAIELNNNYGYSTMHLMRDEDGNLFVWTTASKHWEVGSVKTIRGTVKDHRTYKNEKQTVLTRCQEVK